MANSNHEFERNFAVIIGIDKYKDDNIRNLETAVNDAEKFAEIIKKRHEYLIDKYKKSNQYNVLLLTDENAAKSKLYELAENFKKGKTSFFEEETGKIITTEVKKNDRLLFYFAGHGLAREAEQDQEGPMGYFIPQDAIKDDVTTYWLMQELHDALNKLECRHMLAIFDCCFAGAFHWVRRVVNPRVKVYKERYDRFIQDRAWQVITSAAHDQEAWDSSGTRGKEEYKGKNHSPFAIALFDAISQKDKLQNADVNKDGIITANELYLYLRDKVEISTDKNFKRQTPGYCPLRKHDKGEFIFLLPTFDRDKLEDAPAIDPENNPYRGLQPYEEQHSDLFFGRDKHIKELYKKVNQNALTVVAGATGAGKSSLVKAGLIPNWRREHLNYLEEEFNSLQKQIDKLNNKIDKLQNKINNLQEQLRISNYVNKPKKSLRIRKEKLEKLVQKKENIQKELVRKKRNIQTQREDINDFKTQEDKLIEKIRKAKLSQDVLNLQKELQKESSQNSDDLTEEIQSLIKEELDIRKMEDWSKRNYIYELKIQAEKAKSIYSFLEASQSYLTNLITQLNLEFNSLKLKHNLNEVLYWLEKESKKLIEESHNKQTEENLLKILRQNLELHLQKFIQTFKEQLNEKQTNCKSKLNSLRVQLETQLRSYIIKVHLGDSPIKALYDSLDQVLSFATPNYQKENKTLNDRLEKWKNHNIRQFGDQRLLIIDQFEEIFKLCKDKKEQKDFFNLLAQLIKENSKWLRIILIVNSESEPLFRATALNKYWEEAMFTVPQMTRSELQKVIEEPATLRVVNFEVTDNHNFVDKLLDEMRQTQGSLPLLSLLLHQLYNKLLDRNKGNSDSRTLTINDYEELGGLAKVLTNKLELECEILVTSDEVFQNNCRALQNLWRNFCSRIIAGFYLLAKLQKAHAIGKMEVVNLRNDGKELPTNATISSDNQILPTSQVKLVQDLELKESYKEFEDLYKQFKELYKQYKKSYQIWEKTIRNVMLRMVAMDSHLACRCVLKSELKYPQEEEEKRVTQVIEAFANAHLLVKKRAQEQETVELAHDMILQWSKLMMWAKEADEKVPFSLRRRLMQNAMAWKDEKNNNTKPKYLLRNVHELELLKKVSNSNDNWLNKFEHEFVQESEKQSQIEPLILKAEQVYEQLVNSEQSSQKSQSLTWEKTIRNVMLRMVAIDNNLAHQRVLISELEYPKEEENQRVNRVIDEFVSAGLLLQTPPDEKIYVEPVNDALMQKWDRLWTWKWTHKENLILLRQLTKAAVEWQCKNKERKLLWDHNPNLDSLKRVVNSEDDNWLNQLENEFVKESSRQKESSNRTKLLTELTKLLGNLTKSPILWTLPLLILLATLVFKIFPSSQVSSERISRTISSGEKILTTPGKLTWLKQAGVNEINTDNFGKAKGLLKDYLKKEPNDPEALIYLNNARIGKNYSYTIATSVPISSDINTALEILRGVAQAQDEINKAGGINGVPLRVLIADDNNNPNFAKQIAEKFIQNSKILGVVGHYSSDDTLAAGEVYNSGKLVVISPVSTLLTRKGFSKYIFCTVPSDAVAARALADYMLNRLGKKKAAVFYSSKSESSQSLKGKFVSAIASSKGQLANELVFDLSNSNFDANQSVEQAIQQGAEVLVLLANTEELDKALLVVKANNKRLPLLAGDDVYTSKVLKEGAEDAVGMIVSVPWHILAEPKSNFEKNFVTTSKNIWQAPINWRTAMSYDATLGLISAIKQNPKPTREGIAETLLSKGFTGATGEIKFSSGERSQKVNQLVKIIKTGSSSSSGYGYDFVPEN